MAIALEAGDKPDVRVMYFFANDKACYPLGVKCFSQCVCDLTDNFVIFSNRGHVPHPSVVFFGNDQNMSLVKRPDIEKCFEVFVFKNGVAWDFSCCYFAKNTFFFHMSSIPSNTGIAILGCMRYNKLD